MSKIIFSTVSRLSKSVEDVKKKVAHFRTQKKTHKKNESPVDIPLPKEKVQRQVVDISMGSVIKATLGVLLVYSAFTFFYLIQDILIILGVSFFLAAALNPMVNLLERKGLSRGVGTLIAYIVLILSVLVIVVSIVPILAVQGDKLLQQLIAYLSRIAQEGVTSVPIPFLPSNVEMWMVESINTFRTNVNLDIIFSQAGSWLAENQSIIRENLQGLANNFFGVLSSVANGIGNIFLILLLSYFIIVDKAEVKKFFLALVPINYKSYASHKLSLVQEKIGAWVKGQMQLNIIIGLSTYLGLWVLSFIGVDIPYKETLAIIAGVTEMIPIVGPIIAAMFAVLVVANMGPVPVISVLILFFLVQQLENNIIVPVVMNHAVGLNPIIIIIGMLIGAQFFGLLGLILSIPVATIIALFVQDILTPDPDISQELP